MEQILTRTKLDLDDLLRKIRQQQQRMKDSKNQRQRSSNDQNLKMSTTVKLFQKPWPKKNVRKQQLQPQQIEATKQPFYVQQFNTTTNDSHDDDGGHLMDDDRQNSFDEDHNDGNSLFYKNLDQYPEYDPQQSRFCPFHFGIPFYTKYTNQGKCHLKINQSIN